MRRSRQQKRVFVNGAVSHDWPVSTARGGYITPNELYRIGLMAAKWRSRQYHGSPMPHAMFFRSGYAIHGTGAAGQLGRRASPRLHPPRPRQRQPAVEPDLTHGGASVVVRN